MQTPVSAKDKKSFIQWFLNHYQLKKRESVWILNYIVNHQKLLDNVHFVREAKFCPRGLIMSSQCSDAVPFRFYKKQLVTTDAEKAFHDIRMNQHEPLYIQLNFNKSYQSIFYAAVLVENPFIPDDYFITGEDQDLAKRLLEKTIYDYQQQAILKKIDEALDKRDQQAFTELTDHLRKLNNMTFDQPFGQI
ncbi:ReoY family proteolytic degradation factor [Lentibacillus sp. CBA3610]|uniref:ReoY family proteolytic degradation factor n=1 Tax=Lentibacillus sp. CBA3610 TaxID=2518176 RepID=UPI001596190E|nr:ReoY family proteolytic degradation factor [Lentibacillus sp. CBA3610]QKY69198.1 YpiB family protein [Lentibacillus sp. CBA3610]